MNLGLASRLGGVCLAISCVPKAQASWWPFSYGDEDRPRPSGAVYAFGRYFGRFPRKIDGVPDAVDVAVRDDLGAAVTPQGDLYAFTADGDVLKLPLSGRAKSAAVRGEPRQIVALDTRGTLTAFDRTPDGFDAPRALGGALKRIRVEQLDCGEAHCVALASGVTAAYTWGDDSHGQLGRGTVGGAQEEPVRVEVQGVKSPLVAAACGDKHTVLLDAEGGVYACGDDKWTQLGRTAEPWASAVVEREPERELNNGVLAKAALIADLPVAQVAAGGQHTAVLVRDGTLFTFGYNTYGQLAHHNYNTFAPPSPSADIELRASDISAGGNSTCVRTPDGALRCIGSMDSLRPSSSWSHPRPRGVKGRVTHAHAVAQGGDACAFVRDSR